jgi:hypothetical protein
MVNVCAVKKFEKGKPFTPMQIMNVGWAALVSQNTQVVLEAEFNELRFERFKSFGHAALLSDKQAGHLRRFPHRTSPPIREPRRQHLHTSATATND